MSAVSLVVCVGFIVVDVAAAVTALPFAPAYG